MLYVCWHNCLCNLLHLSEFWPVLMSMLWKVLQAAWQQLLAAVHSKATVCFFSWNFLLALRLLRKMLLSKTLNHRIRCAFVGNIIHYQSLLLIKCSNTTQDNTSGIMSRSSLQNCSQIWHRERCHAIIVIAWYSWLSSRITNNFHDINYSYLWTCHPCWQMVFVLCSLQELFDFTCGFRLAFRPLGLIFFSSLSLSSSFYTLSFLLSSTKPILYLKILHFLL